MILNQNEIVKTGLRKIKINVFLVYVIQKTTIYYLTEIRPWVTGPTRVEKKLVKI